MRPWPNDSKCLLDVGKSQLLWVRPELALTDPEFILLELMVGKEVLTSGFVQYSCKPL